MWTPLEINTDVAVLVSLICCMVFHEIKKGWRNTVAKHWKIQLSSSVPRKRTMESEGFLKFFAGMLHARKEEISLIRQQLQVIQEQNNVIWNFLNQLANSNIPNQSQDGQSTSMGLHRCNM